MKEPSTHTALRVAIRNLAEFHSRQVHATRDRPRLRIPVEGLTNPANQVTQAWVEAGYREPYAKCITDQLIIRLDRLHGVEVKL